ncbi:MAG TPA: transketolase [Ktedonobacterales bacterium]
MPSEASKALLLDNDLFFVAKVRETLRHAGYETQTVRRAADYAQALAEERPAIALVNTQARGIDWSAAIAAARAVGVPVIAFGAHVDVATQQAARAAGATRVISNAKLASDLVSIVSATLARGQRATTRQAAMQPSGNATQGRAGPSRYGAGRIGSDSTEESGTASQATEARSTMSTVEQAQSSTNQMQQWHELAQQLRVDSIRSTTAAGSGHPTSSMSGADLMAVLMSSYLRYDFNNPANPNNDHLIFSKGHAAPLLYSMFKAAGAIKDEEMMTLRKEGSRIEGHPVPVLPWVDVATGSLGQGLPIGVGIGLAGKYLDKLPYHMWVLMGDSEMAEGSIYEAMELGGYYKLNNLIGILDMNRLGQRGQTMLGWDAPVYAARAQAFGWHTISIDGHNLNQIAAAYDEALKQENQPTLIVAQTIKGKGFSEIENKEGWHGKPLPPDMAERAIKELGGVRNIHVSVAPPQDLQPAAKPAAQAWQAPSYPVGSAAATRVAYGDALKALGAARPDVVAVDAEVSNSTYAETFAKAYPDRFFEQFIAEEQMIASAVGLAVRHYIPFASTFAAFFSRAYDFIRMAAISRANIKLCGSHAGVSIGEDGPSQMGLEDIAAMRAVFRSKVLYPCDPNETAELVRQMADEPGIVYLRTTREKTPVIYQPGENFPIGGSRVVRQSDADQVSVVGAGITLHEALKAYDALKSEGITIRVIDAYTVKPIDVATLQDAARATNGQIVVVEDHWFEGGLGDAVLDAFAGSETEPPTTPLPKVTKLAVNNMPGSATPEQQIELAGISASHIIAAVKRIVGKA